MAPGHPHYPKHAEAMGCLVVRVRVGIRVRVRVRLEHTEVMRCLRIGFWLWRCMANESVTAWHGRDRPYIYAGGVMVMHHDPL